MSDLNALRPATEPWPSRTTYFLCNVFVGRIWENILASGFTRGFEMFSLEEKDELVAFVANLRAEIMISPPEDQLELLPNGLLRLGTSLSAKLAAAASYHHLHLRHPIDLSHSIATNNYDILFADSFMLYGML